MNLLEMQHVKKGFGENEVLKDISLSVAEVIASEPCS